MDDKVTHKSVRRLCLTAAALLLARHVCSGDLEVAKEALRDGLYPVAETYAGRALTLRGADAEEALLALLESLDGQRRFAEMLRRLDAEGELVRGARLREAFGGCRCDSQRLLAPVHRAAVLRECPALGQTIFEHAPASRAAAEYGALVWEVLDAST